MATVYHRDQPGAPVLTYSTASNSLAQFTALKAILKAVLIQGYGSQPPAGWELINEGANFIVLRNGAHSGYVCLTWISGGVVRVYLSETYTGMTGDVMDGDGLKTGIGANNTPAHTLSARFLVRGTAHSTWCVVADERTFVLSIISSATAVDLPLDSTISNYVGLTLYLGEDSSGNFIAVGGAASDVINGGNSNVVGRFSAGAGFTSLKNPVTGLLVGNGSLWVATPGVATDYTTGYYPNVYLIPAVCLSKIHWFGGDSRESNIHGGSLRGIAQVPELGFITFPAIAANSLGLTETLTARTGNTPLDLGDGHSYFARLAYYYAAFFLITDNPEFW